MAELRGLVLAGGESRRFGRDKAAESTGDRPLLERTAAALAPFVAHVHVAVRPPQRDDAVRRGFDLLLDEAAGIGPAAGLLAAHANFPDAAWLVVACDLPRLGAATLAALVAARDPGRSGVAFRAPGDGRPEPLCAIYEPATLSRFRARVRAGGSPSPRDLLTDSDAVLLAPPDDAELFNMNTPDDLRRLREDGA